MGGAHGDRALVVGVRHRAQRGLGYADDGRQDHDAEQDGRGQNGRARGDVRPEELGHIQHDRRDDDHAEEAVYDGRDAREQLGARLEDAVDALRAVERHEDSGQQADRHADNNCACGDVKAADDHRQDAVNVIARTPGRAGQEVEEPNLLHGRDAVGKQENADQGNCEDGSECTDKEHAVHHVFTQVSPAAPLLESRFVHYFFTP